MIGLSGGRNHDRSIAKLSRRIIIGGGLMINPIHAAFDFVAFKRAFVSKDVKTWLGFFAEDAEWIEYKPTHPPKTPRLMKGKSEIRDFLADVKASNITLAIEDEVIGSNRAAFCVWCTLPDGKQVVENVIIHISDGKITRQVDVEAWD